MVDKFGVSLFASVVKKDSIDIMKKFVTKGAILN